MVGPVGSVRGSGSSVTPASYSGLIAWYSADCINAGACASQPSNGTNLAGTNWSDRSSSANNLALASETITFSTNVLNGLPAITFPTSSTSTFNTAITWPGAETVFIVFKYSASSSAQIQVIAGPTDSLQWYSYVTPAVWKLDKGGVVNIGTGSNTLSQSTWYQANMTYNSTSGAWAIREAEAADASGTSAQSITATQTTAMAGFGVSGQIVVVEEFVYNVVLTGPQITALEGYLNTKYGI